MSVNWLCCVWQLLHQMVDSVYVVWRGTACKALEFATVAIVEEVVLAVLLQHCFAGGQEFLKRLVFRG